MDSQAAIDDFLAGRVFAVVGASRNRDKYGNKVLRCYLQNDLIAWPVNPNESEVEGAECFASLTALPEPVHGVSLITPPQVTEGVVDEAAQLGIRRLWMQPGSESDSAVARAEELGIAVISGGPCILVSLNYKEG